MWMGPLPTQSSRAPDLALAHKKTQRHLQPAWVPPWFQPHRHPPQHMHTRTLMSSTSRHMWCMPPSGFFFRKLAMGELSPSGAISSNLVFSSCTNTTVTPCSGTGWGSLTVTPRMERYLSAAAARSGTAMATWFSRPTAALDWCRACSPRACRDKEWRRRGDQARHACSTVHAIDAQAGCLPAWPSAHHDGGGTQPAGRHGQCSLRSSVGNAPAAAAPIRRSKPHNKSCILQCNPALARLALVLTHR